MAASSVFPPSSSDRVSLPQRPLPLYQVSEHTVNSNMRELICRTSGIIREPLKGVEAICPIGNSFDSPELELAAWLASPETTIKNFVQANTSRLRSS